MPVVAVDAATALPLLDVVRQPGVAAVPAAEHPLPPQVQCCPRIAASQQR